MHNPKKFAFLLIISIVLTFGLTLSFNSLIAAWNPPPAAPPQCPAGSPGCSEPLNSGTSTQQKLGSLFMNLMRNENGLVIFGKVGIGTTTPNRSVVDVNGASLLHIYSTSTTANAELDIQSVAGTNNHWGIYQDRTTQNLMFWNNNASTTGWAKNVMTISTSSYGSVGIGTSTNLTAKLTVNGDIKAYGRICDGEGNCLDEIGTIPPVCDDGNMLQYSLENGWICVPNIAETISQTMACREIYNNIQYGVTYKTGASTIGPIKSITTCAGATFAVGGFSLWRLNGPAQNKNWVLEKTFPYNANTVICYNNKIYVGLKGSNNYRGYVYRYFWDGATLTIDNFPSGDNIYGIFPGTIQQMAVFDNRLVVFASRLYAGVYKGYVYIRNNQGETGDFNSDFLLVPRTNYDCVADGLTLACATDALSLSWVYGSETAFTSLNFFNVVGDKLFFASRNSTNGYYIQKYTSGSLTVYYLRDYLLRYQNNINAVRLFGNRLYLGYEDGRIVGLDPGLSENSTHQYDYGDFGSSIFEIAGHTNYLFFGNPNVVWKFDDATLKNAARSRDLVVGSGCNSLNCLSAQKNSYRYFTNTTADSIVPAQTILSNDLNSFLASGNGMYFGSENKIAWLPDIQTMPPNAFPPLFPMPVAISRYLTFSPPVVVANRNRIKTPDECLNSSCLLYAYRFTSGGTSPSGFVVNYSENSTYMQVDMPEYDPSPDQDAWQSNNSDNAHLSGNNGDNIASDIIRINADMILSDDYNVATVFDEERGVASVEASSTYWTVYDNDLTTGLAIVMCPISYNMNSQLSF
jgi:hypothetical protein